MSYNEVMKKEDIKKLQEQIDIDESEKSKPAEKKLKIHETFDEVLKKMARPKKK